VPRNCCCFCSPVPHALCSSLLTCTTRQLLSAFLCQRQLFFNACLCLPVAHDSYKSLLTWHTTAACLTYGTRHMIVSAYPIPHGSCLSQLTCATWQLHVSAYLCMTAACLCFSLPNDPNNVLLVSACLRLSMSHDRCLSLLIYATRQLLVSAYLCNTTAACLCLPMPHGSCLSLLICATGQLLIFAYLCHTTAGCLCLPMPHDSCLSRLGNHVPPLFGLPRSRAVPS
jgi:hypothetical protein